MTVVKATVADKATLASISAGADHPDVRCNPDVAFPTGVELDRILLCYHVYFEGNAFVAVRDDGVIKWLVGSRQSYNTRSGTVWNLIDHVHQVHGQCSGHVTNVKVLTALANKHIVDTQTGWVTYKPPE